MNDRRLTARQREVLLRLALYRANGGWLYMSDVQYRTMEPLMLHGLVEARATYSAWIAKILPEGRRRLGKSPRIDSDTTKEEEP